ncbi:MAG: tRNA uridine-5-carboxymethylaminomethyl(34) synthesis GTPase MnmE [Deltaproteobacteria bacterium CG2_30_63_29]|nr:MAG: tRNA uridine-5-carboxymethylaminomethyl(34) synthesis GTPase MnmE [Deltaproteobacteria bacterium CG2_30_63_29]
MKIAGDARDETISAIATATGAGAVGIVRVSGRNALEVLRGCFLGLPELVRSHHLYYGRVVHPATGELLDEAMAVLMRSPRSFTGEDVVELQTHGGSLNLKRVLEATLSGGARLAEAGEFSLRAFLNGRLDLTQAEAVADLIVSETEQALRAAQSQLGGGLRRPIGVLRQALLDLLTLMEACLDFAEEEHVLQASADEITQQLEAVLAKLEAMQRAHGAGRLRLGGTTVVLVGAPNVGKSSLFNCLLGYDRAIVTETPGTTRDVLEGTITLSSQRVHVADTAGLRESVDPVEKLGIERSLEEVINADIVCHVIDATQREGLSPLARADAIVVINKVDALSTEEVEAEPRSRRQRRSLSEEVQRGLGDASLTVVTASARTGEGLAWLEHVIAERAAGLQYQSPDDVPLLTNIRHVAAITDAVEALSRARHALETNLPLELSAADVREAAEALGRIVGVIVSDDVLNEIFSRFCVGK